MGRPSLSPIPYLTICIYWFLHPLKVYESWPPATGPRPVLKPAMKKPGEEGESGDGQGLEADEGEPTPEGNKRSLADILSVRG